MGPENSNRGYSVEQLLNNETITTSHPSTNDVRTSNPRPHRNANSSVQHPTSRDENISIAFDADESAMTNIDYRSVVDAMKRKLMDTLGLEPSEEVMMNRLVSNACELDEVLVGRAEIHVIITTTEGSHNDMVAPIVSKLLLTALDRRRATAAFSSQSVADAFSVAKRSLHVTNAGINGRRPKCPKMSAPTWSTTRTSFEPQQDSGNLRHLTIDEDILTTIEKLNIDDLVRVYGEFFHHVWKICKKQNGWKGNIVYEKLTPTWLYGDVVFIYGTNDALSIP